MVVWWRKAVDRVVSCLLQNPWALNTVQIAQLRLIPAHTVLSGPLFITKRYYF